MAALFCRACFYLFAISGPEDGFGDQHPARIQHHIPSPFFINRRLVTLFLYLNNLPQGQGCTEFPALNIRITPERGAVVFVSVSCVNICCDQVYFNCY